MIIFWRTYITSAEFTDQLQKGKESSHQLGKELFACSSDQYM